MFVMTLEQLTTAQRVAIMKLIETAGSISHLARMLGVKAATVQGWSDRGRISKSGAKLVAKHPELRSKFHEYDLRPELEYQENK